MPASLQATEPAPASGGKHATKLAVTFAGGNLIALILRLVTGLLTARIVGPAILGKFTAASLVLGYLPMLHLGVVNGLGRDLPYYIGAGRKELALKLAAVTEFWVLAIGGASVIGCCVVSARYALGGDWQLSTAWATNSVSAFFLFYAQQYLQVTYRTIGDFSKLALASVIQSVVLLAATAGVWAWQFEGLCLRALCVCLANSVLLWLWRPMKVEPNWNSTLFLQLLKTGVPIFAVGQLWALWPVLDSTLVLLGTGSKGLGLYALSTMAMSGAIALSASFNQVVYPRMAEEYGRSGSPARALRLALSPTAFLVAIMLIYLIGSIALLGPFVKMFLPKYMSGLPAARWSFGAAALLALMPPLDLFAVIKRQFLAAVCLLGGVATYLGIIYASPGHRASLELYPKAMIAGFAVYLAASYGMLRWLVQRPQIPPAALPADQSGI